MIERQSDYVQLRSMSDGSGGSYMMCLVWCPGCAKPHMLRVSGSQAWEWDGNLEKPTFSPSLLIKANFGEPPVTPENAEEYRKNPWPQTLVEKVCHSFIRDGVWQFLPDSTHQLSGQSFSMVPIPAWLRKDDEQ